MKRSGDLVIGRSGDRKGEFTAEARSRGEELGENLTTETRRHGESQGSGDRGIARHRVIGETIDICDDLVIKASANISDDLEIRHAASICHPERAGATATASRRTPTRLVLRNAISGSSHETLKDLFRRFESATQTIRATLREIFDESAYDRFLLRTNDSRSVASYRDFTRERDAALLQKPRCC